MVAAGAPINASDVNTRIGYAERTTDSSTWTTTETSVLSVTVSLTSGRKYRVTFDGSVRAGTLGDCHNIRIRQDSVSGTEMQLKQVYCDTTGSVGFTVTAIIDYTASATGSKTFHVTGIRNDGTGTGLITGAATRPSHITVELVNQA